VTVELPRSFVVERCGTRQIRVRVRRPDGRPRARLLHADVVFDDGAVRTGWNERQIHFDARTLRIARRRRGAAVLIRHALVSLCDESPHRSPHDLTIRRN